MTSLTREAILAAKDLKSEVVKVPEWGGEVTVGTMTGEMRDAWEQSFLTEKGKPDIRHARARLAVFCIVDEKGERIFTEADILALSKKSAAGLQRIVDVAQRLNLVRDEDVRDAAKN